MELAILIPVAAVTVGPLAWVASNWIKARHGYPLNAETGEFAERESPRLRAENEALKQTVQRLEGRLQVLERIATDPAERTAREIDGLR